MHFLVEKQGKIQPGVFLSVLKCFLAMWFEQWVSITLKYIQFPYLRQCSLRHEFFAQLTATMMYYVVERMTPALILEHSIYYKILEHMYIQPCSLIPRRHATWDTGSCMRTANWDNQLIEGSVLKTKGYHTTPGMPENVTFLGDARWIGGLTKVVIYPMCANFHWKIAVLTTPIHGLSGSRVASYLVTCKQLKKTNLGCLGWPQVFTVEQIKNTSLSGYSSTPQEAWR